MSIRVLLVDDHAIMRDCLRALIEGRDDMEVIAEAENGREAVELAKELLPDIVTMDVTMPVLDGIEATRQITSQFQMVKVIALSGHSRQIYVDQMLSAGAAVYMSKTCSSDEFVHVIRTVAAGIPYLPFRGQCSIQERCAATTLVPRIRGEAGESLAGTSYC